MVVPNNSGGIQLTTFATDSLELHGFNHQIFGDFLEVLIIPPLIPWHSPFLMGIL